MRRLVLFSVLALASFGHAQSVAEALRAPAKTLQVADLPEDFRAVSLGNGGMESISTLGMFAMRSAGEMGGDGAEAALFLSLMGATFVNPDEFAELLEGKRARIRSYAFDITSMMNSSSGMSGTPTPVFTENWIEAGRIVQWSPRPALTKEALVKAFGKAGTPNSNAGLSNVKQVALGFIMYSADEDDNFPKANSTAAAQALVEPYLKNNSVWTSPNGGRILYNTALSGLATTAIENPANTLLVWEEKPYEDGSRSVGYADGHAKRVTATEWDTIWKAELSRRAARKKSKV